VDGTRTAEGAFSVEGSTLKMSAQGETILCNFRISGKKLILEMDGAELVLAKK